MVSPEEIKIESNFPDPWIRTFTKKRFYYKNSDTESVCIEDIAHALSQLVRYTGHAKYFYSVAQHSVLVSHLVPEEMALEGLLHDSPETYMNDLPSPLKTLLPDYKELEDSVEATIAHRFGLRYPMPPEIKEIDKRIVIDEALILLDFESVDELINLGWSYPDTLPLGITISEYWDSTKAELEFLNRFYELHKKRT